tara:strand:- start:360 stop:944 length:585 start_codon:yes stop_codon:yes gene_type:complete
MKLIFIFLLSSSLWGQFEKPYYGFGLDIGSSGSGLFLNSQIPHNSKVFSLNIELRFYDIKDPNESIVYDPYYGTTRTIGGISLLMLPVFVGFNFYPFVDKIQNNFSPFFAARWGGLVTLNGGEEGSFKNRWNNIDTQFSLGGFLGFGVDFKMYGQTTVSPMVGYEILPLRYKADGEKDYSGMLIHIAFNRKFAS